MNKQMEETQQGKSHRIKKEKGGEIKIKIKKKEKEENVTGRTRRSFFFVKLIFSPLNLFFLLSSPVFCGFEKKKIPSSSYTKNLEMRVRTGSQAVYAHHLHSK